MRYRIKLRTNKTGLRVRGRKTQDHADTGSGASPFNLPNVLTIFRIFLVPVFMFFLLTRIQYGNYLAAGVFVMAAVTDSLDGYIARRRKQVTKLGIILDPLADKLLITSALISLVQLGQVAAWVAVIILGREFAVTGLRAVKAEEGIIIPAGVLGKLKTLSQIVAIILVILEDFYHTLLSWPIGDWAMYLAVILTVASGLVYFWRWK